MALAESDRQPFYLRIFFRLLSSWAHQADAYTLSPAPIFSTPEPALSQRPGLAKVLLVDLAVGRRLTGIYNHLHLRKSSPLSRLQREMLAVVINGHVHGAP